MLLVLTAGRIRANELTSALERIGLSGTPVVGVVLNRIDAGDEGYYYAYRSENEFTDSSSDRVPTQPQEEEDSPPARHFRLRPRRSSQEEKS